MPQAFGDRPFKEGAADVGPSRLPCQAGIGLKPEHFHEILAQPPKLGFFEIHAENYMVAGGPYHFYLEKIREIYPLSIHGVGLSIGGQGTLDEAHLSRLATLLNRYQPESFSEHLAWSSHGGMFLNDLLPLPYTQETLTHVCAHIEHVQERLGRRMLLENPATYVQFRASNMSENEFISEIIGRTGCGLLLDVNNVHVACANHGGNAHEYILGLPLQAIDEIHLAGFAEERDSTGAPLLIDSHGTPVAPSVWELYAFTLGLTGPKPTLIERDNNVPALADLLTEAGQAEALMNRLFQRPPGQHARGGVPT
ncbi:DUF692 domain-containing protein [Pseudomonas aeruginosa]|uniref:MNIO family bufferin maturase n=1 Tax=Pseudomonas aeruginosa TaxID=287 RepID=UPI0027BFCA1D|nr:DUF692 domain-containing protein [Pseudomonas aeruginosa]MDQ2578884.1 DUF692 domain-containing protein [Pseudomonas aeruginosa]MDQ2605577.1 DUF692 domain-containing protein [Pseudomonas aeruginosa]MDT8189529.1 DUF692 domain-containing protein [Pseudomonas aeruginosa]MDT8211649.1 DUF692 domain-containing protein [Pseudomonas aeruginosa]HBP6529882.1 DUF692 domain-containing protein [Pseudomonas aeruginosa]